MLPPISLKDHFKGLWLLSRTYSTGESFHGEAIFESASDHVLSYKETGSITTNNGQILEAWREYSYRIDSTRIQIFFDTEQTRLFQDLIFESAAGQLHAQGTHQCPPDIYKTQFTLLGPEMFEIEHDVAGPKKAYISKAVYTKF